MTVIGVTPIYEFPRVCELGSGDPKSWRDLHWLSGGALFGFGSGGYIQKGSFWRKPDVQQDQHVAQGPRD